MATAVIARLSRRPARISVHRVTKSGRSHPAKNALARDSPSAILAGSMSTVTKARSPYNASPPMMSHRWVVLSIIRGGRHGRADSVTKDLVTPHSFISVHSLQNGVVQSGRRTVEDHLTV